MMTAEMTADVQFWDRLAERYARKPVPNPAAYERKLVVTKARLHSEDTILDVGCGTGSLALELAPHVRQVHAIDVSGEMIKIANRKAQNQQVTNVAFHKLTLDDSLPFRAEAFDCICVYNLLHLLEDRAGALKKVFELLRPGAFFISSTVCLGESYVPYRPILSVMRWLGKAPFVQIITHETLTKEIEQTGFVDISTPDVGANNTTAFVVAKKPMETPLA